MKGAAADWFEGISAIIGDNWATTTNGGNNFVDLFQERFINETKKNQWYQELSVLRQQTDESVDSYANKFKKLVNRIGMTDNVQKKRMFLMGLNPAYTPLVYSQNPADLDAAVNSARTIEIGYNFATGRMPKNLNTTTSITPATSKSTFASNEVDELTKRMEQLSLNYANLTTALLAQPQAPPRRRNFNNERNFPMNEILMRETSTITEIFLIHKEDHNKQIYHVLIVEKLDTLAENALHPDSQNPIVTYYLRIVGMFI